MRKGLRITLGALAAFAMVHSASFALAPVFTKPLPDVIVHDKEGNVGRTMDMNYFVYVNAFDIREFFRDDDSPTSHIRFVFFENNSWNDYMIGNPSRGATQFRLDDPDLDIDDVSTWAQQSERVEITQGWNATADQEGDEEGVAFPLTSRVWWWAFRNLLYSPEIAGGVLDQSVQPNAIRSQYGRFDFFGNPLGPYHPGLTSQLGPNPNTGSIFRFGPFPEPIGGQTILADGTITASTGTINSWRVWGNQTPGVYPGGDHNNYNPATNGGVAIPDEEGIGANNLIAGFTSTTRLRLMTTGDRPGTAVVGPSFVRSSNGSLQGLLAPRRGRRDILLYMADLDGNITTTTFGVYAQTGGNSTLDCDRLSIAVETLFKDDFVSGAGTDWSYVSDGTGPLGDATSGSGAGFISLQAGATAPSAAPFNKWFGNWTTTTNSGAVLANKIPAIASSKIYRARFNVTPSGVPASGGASDKRNIPQVRMGPSSVVEAISVRNLFGSLEDNGADANPHWNNPGTATDLDVIWSGHVDAPNVGNLAIGGSGNSTGEDLRGFKMAFEVLDTNITAGQDDAGVMTLNQVCVEAHPRPGNVTPVTTITDFRTSAGWTSITQTAAITVTENGDGSIRFNDAGLPNTTAGQNGQFFLRERADIVPWVNGMERVKVTMAVPTSVSRDVFHRFRVRLITFNPEVMAQEFQVLQQNVLTALGNPWVPANSDTQAGATTYEVYQSGHGGPSALILSQGAQAGTFKLALDALHNLGPASDNDNPTAVAVYQATIENLGELPG